MHISIQVCSIIIVQFLAIIFSRQKKLGTRSERIFLEILIITLISLVLDISSVAAIYYKESCPRAAEVALRDRHDKSFGVAGYFKNISYIFN